MRYGTVTEAADIFTSIDSKKLRLDKLRPLTAGEAQRLHDEFMIDFTYNSNAIEGNTLTLRETAMVLEGMTIDRKPLKDHLEAVGHRDAFLYIEKLAQNKTKLHDTEIKAIHSLVLMDRPEDKGIYRRIPVTIAGAYTEPVQPYLIEPEINTLLAQNEDRKKTMHPIERIARFHLEFEGIHPFIDGNGRTGRLLLNLELTLSVQGDTRSEKNQFLSLPRCFHSAYVQYASIKRLAGTKIDFFPTLRP